MKFLICVNNTGYEDSLEVLKLYRVLSDPVAEQHGMVRVVDEDAEDYLFEKECFIDPKLDETVASQLARRSA